MTLLFDRCVYVSHDGLDLLKYVGDNPDPGTLQVNADDYTMNYSSFIYYQDKGDR